MGLRENPLVVQIYKKLTADNLALEKEIDDLKVMFFFAVYVVLSSHHHSLERLS